MLRVPLEVDGLDGFSAWVGRDREVPTICMVGESVAYRGRYTISEELGHLILHTPLRVPIDQAEEEAKEFVGEFVLPEEAMRLSQRCGTSGEPPSNSLRRGLGSLKSLRPISIDI